MEKELNEDRQIVFDEICRRIIAGESLRAILRDKEMPCRQTFYNWIEKDQNLVDQYARATTARADNIFDEIIEIADSQENDIIEVEGKEVTNHNAIQRNRLMVDARKWALAKMNPKKYGEKVDLTSGGEKIKSVSGFMPDGFDDE